MYPYIIKKIILPVSDRLLGLSVNNELKKNRYIQWCSQKELEIMQTNNLKNILLHSSKNVPYYKKIFTEHGLEINENIYRDFKNIPFLTKSLIKDNLPDNIIDKTIKIYSKDNTSGSSGHQCVFYHDRLAYSKHIAIQSLWWEWSGFRFGEKVLQTGMTTQRGIAKTIKDKIFQVNYTQAFLMDHRTIKKNLQHFRNKKNIYFMGYASSLFTYAQFADQSNIKDVRFNAVVSWGDKMFPHYRDLIERTFKTKVFDTYGAAEGLMIAAECEEHNYHIMTHHVLIEILDQNGQEVKDGEIGEVFVTRLDNYLMPLIRYRIGDLAVRSSQDKKCPCGRNFPMIEKIVGRDTDIVFTPRGKALIVHFFTGIFEHIPEIKQFQVVQNINGGDIEIRYIKANDFSFPILKKAQAKMYKKAGEEFPLFFNPVENIEPSPSGKPQIVMRNY